MSEAIVMRAPASGSRRTVIVASLLVVSVLAAGGGIWSAATSYKKEKAIKSYRVALFDARQASEAGSLALTLVQKSDSREGRRAGIFDDARAAFLRDDSSAFNALATKQGDLAMDANTQLIELEGLVRLLDG